MNDMEAIDHFNLWSFDLNLLVVFDAIMRDRSITKSAARLRLQQPAMSHNLATLRVLLQDELFTRVGHTMVPTPRAHSLAGPVRQLLTQVNGVLASQERFDPKADKRTFRMGFSSEFEVTLLPQLVAQLRFDAPGVKVLAQAALPDEVGKLLDDGAIDIAVGGYEEGSKRHHRSMLFDRNLLCCFNPRLVRIDGDIGLEQYVGHAHALVSQNEAIEGCLERALKRANIALNVVMAAPEFLTVLTAVSQTPLLTTVPSRIFEQYGTVFGLASCPVPVRLDIRPISMIWLAHMDKEPALMWLRNKIGSLLSDRAIENRIAAE